MLRPQHRGRPHRDRRAQHGTEVLRILYLVESDEERLRVHGQRVERLEAQAWGEGQRALMANAARESVELRARGPLDTRAVIVCEASQGLELRRLFASARFDEDSLESLSVGTDGLAHGLNARDETTAQPAFPAAATSSAMRRAAASGSAASRMGRPTTTHVAPARMASPAVIVRFWSSSPLPEGRTPGVMIVAEVPRAPRSRDASRGEHTNARTPSAQARRPRRSTCAGKSSPTPVAV